MTMAVAREGDLMGSEQEQRLSERVASASQAARAIHLDDGTIVVVLDVFPLESKTTIPSVTYREPLLRRMLGWRRSTRSTRSIARQSIHG